MSLSNPINPPLVNEAVAKPLSTGSVFGVDENQTRLNQIHGINPAGSTGAGIPKPVSSVSASMANASLGSTSTINLVFQRDPSDKNFARVVIYAKGYQGNNTPVQVGSTTESPATVILNNTGESVSLILQSVGNGGVSPIANSPSCSIKLPKNTNGGVGTQTVTNLTTSQIPTSGGSGSLSISQAVAPATVNVTTEGSLDWCCNSPANAGNYPNFSWMRWKQTGGELARNLRMVAHIGSQSRGASTSGGGTSFTATDEQADVTDVVSANITSYSGYISRNSNAVGRTGFGYQLDVTATGQAQRTLNIYCGGDMISGSSGAQITVSAQLTDGSAPAVSTTFNIVGGNVNTWKQVAITFKSANSARLFVQILISNANSQLCEIHFQAATLS